MCVCTRARAEHFGPNATWEEPGRRGLCHCVHGVASCGPRVIRGIHFLPHELTIVIVSSAVIVVVSAILCSRVLIGSRKVTPPPAV